jgi:carboxyl-terminal processing protease
MPGVPFARPLAIASLAGVCLAGGYELGLREAGIGRLRAPPAPLSADDRRAFGVLWETLGELERDYYRPEQLDASKLAAGAARGMVEAVGDPYTTLSEPGDLSEAQLRGGFDGIGVELDRRDGRLVVIAPFDDSPADRAGIRAGDAIVAVDGTDMTALSLADAATRIRGPRGTGIVLGLVRDGTRIDVPLVRDAIRVESVRSRLLAGDGPLAYVRITMFSEPTARQVREHLAPLLAQGSKGLVLDLRANPGGYLTAAVDVTSGFLKDGIVLYEQRGTADSRRPYRTTGSPQAPDLPLAVLVDRGSASAAEIVAAALRDNQRAVLIGEKTFGKGTVQEVRALSDDSRLHLTVAQWLTPSGHVIQGEGLQPDIEVAAVEGRDAPLEAAVEYLLRGQAHG